MKKVINSRINRMDIFSKEIDKNLEVKMATLEDIPQMISLKSTIIYIKQKVYYCTDTRIMNQKDLFVLIIGTWYN
ncbi:hypothetical protein LGK97_14445 [Clostridium sp. CS001]|uniref:hypothetical protein n=1 Tax=Clostridium sp. CS001 TaxID=2880648 RepID=UPI001CF0F80E|nr:hypothetical protein [Clostridium sp. CS001]MCB2290944.1 hypothetical protein [Clostridium sp. CS001]